MAIAFTNLTSGNDTSGTSGATTASVTPGSNRLQLLRVESRTNITENPNQPTATGNSLTWVVINSIVFDSASASRRRVTLFRALGASPSAGTIAIDFGGQNQTHCSWGLDEVTGMDTSGTNGSGAIVQSATNSDETLAVTSLTVTLAAFGSADNATYGAFGNSNLTDHQMSVGTGFTLTNNNGSTTSIQGISEYKLSNDTSVDINQVTNAEIGGIAVEIKAAVAANNAGLLGII